MTRRDLNCIHEPFGDAFYFGPERLSDRYEKDEKERLASGFAESTYKTIFDGIDKEAAEVRLPPHREPHCSPLFKHIVFGDGGSLVNIVSGLTFALRVSVSHEASLSCLVSLPLFRIDQAESINRALILPSFPSRFFAVFLLFVI